MNDSMEESKDKEIEDLKSVLEEAEAVGLDIAEQGRKRSESGQEIADIARTAKKVLNEWPKGQAFFGVQNVIADLHHLVDEGRKNREKFSEGHVILTSVSSTASMGMVSMFQSAIIDLPQEVQRNMSWAITDFDNVIKKSSNKDQVVELMISLGLDKSFHKERRSALEHFNIAYDALNRPVTGQTDPANTSIIPMREAIETAIDQLIASRPNRSNIEEIEGENKDSRKIRAIAEQLKRDNIPDYQIDAWARDWVDLKKKLLSPSKTKPMSRDEWSREINQATLFLKGFLSGIDSKNYVYKGSGADYGWKRNSR